MIPILTLFIHTSFHDVTSDIRLQCVPLSASIFILLRRHKSKTRDSLKTFNYFQHCSRYLKTNSHKSRNTCNLQNIAQHCIMFPVLTEYLRLETFAWRQSRNTIKTSRNSAENCFKIVVPLLNCW